MVLLFISALSVNATQLTYTQNVENDPNSRALGYPVPVPVASQTPVDGFREYDSLFARHQDIALSSPLINGQIIGQTTRGNNIWAYILSDDNQQTTEGNIIEGSLLQNGGIHAREWQSPEVITGIMERFFEHQNDQGFYQYLLENSQIILIPVLNVDGFKQTQRYPVNAIFSIDQDDSVGVTPRDGRMRRKNMRGVDIELATENDYLRGIDLNRNNDPYWATNPGRSSSRQESIVHHGSGPASEPETQALQSAAAIANGNLRFYIDTHSFTKIYFAPMTGNARRDNITAQIAGRMRAVNNNTYSYGPSGAGGGIGSTDEYFANIFQVPSYTLETEPGQGGGTDYGGFGVSHDGFILPEAEINRVRNELANASILGYYMQAGPPGISQIQITRTDDDSTVFQGQWQADTTTTRSWQVIENIPLEANVEYRARISFNKAMRWRSNQSITQYPGQSINLDVSVVLEGFDSSGVAYQESLAENGSWLNAIGVANNGYLNYHDDSYLFEFSLSEDSPALLARLQQLAVTTTDLSGQMLDSNPATVVDWRNGFWNGYESTNGNFADTGGVDRTIRLIDDGSPAFTIPATPVGGGNGGADEGGSSGGGSNHFISLLLLLLLAINRQYICSIPQAKPYRN